MHKHIRELIKQETPLMNPEIVNGIAVSHLKHTEDYISGIMTNAINSLPHGLEYLGCERCTPEEEFREVTRQRNNNKRTIDIARSDLYLMKYFFKFNGKDLPPRYLYLPFVGEAGTIYIGGSRFIISPVLTDKVISPEKNSVFVRLLRDKVTFERLNHSIVINDNRCFSQVIWSPIYRKSKDVKKVMVTTKAQTCLSHYLLAKFGFSGAFSKYLNFVPIVLPNDEPETLKNYSKESYVIIKSSKIKPKTFVGNFYKHNDIVLVVPIENWNAETKSFISEFFYVVDHFPTRIHYDALDNTSVWMILLGHIIFSGVYGEGKLYNNICEHFNSIDDYVDDLIVQKFREIGFDIKNFYDLLAVVIKNFNTWIINGSDKVNSLYNKELSILYHVLFEITSAIFRVTFRLNKIATKGQLSEKEVIEVMNKNLTTGLIYRITRSHVNLSNVNYSGDNKFFKMTSIMVPQAKATNQTQRMKQSKSVANDESKKFHVSIPEVGSYLYLPKTSPRGDSRISPYVTIDKNGVVLQNPKHKDLLDKVDKLIRDNQ